jgi:hypothetical protein
MTNITVSPIESTCKTTINPDYQYVGTSFSLCVKSIIDGEIRLDQVIGIESSTKIVFKDDLERVIHAYKETYWEEKPNTAEKIARDIYLNKVFYQPRVENNYYIIGTRPLWMPVEVDNSTISKSEEKEIA